MKAEILNAQYTRVFTNETPVLPTVGHKEFPDMPNIAIDHHNGVMKNPSKATGPDLIPAPILKEAAPTIAPFFTFIFQQSINTGCGLRRQNTLTGREASSRGVSQQVKLGTILRVAKQENHGHPAITDTSMKQTTAKSPAKPNYRHWTEIN